MRRAGEVIVGLLARGQRSWATAEEFRGADAAAIHQLQRLGFLAPDP